MNKEKFLAALRQRLAYLPANEVERSVRFYEESIDDRIEDGMSEAEAVAAMGDVESAARAVELELPLSTIVRQRVSEKKNRSGHSAFWIVAAVLGAPLWLPLLLAAAVVVLAVYLVLWSVIVSLYAVVFAVAVAAVAVLLASFFMLPGGFLKFLLCLGAAFLCAGLAILLFLAFTQAARGLVFLGRQLWRGIKACFVKKGE